MKHFSDLNQHIQDLTRYELDLAFARRARIIMTNIRAHGKEKILEVGCGRGFYEYALSRLFPSVRLVGVDVNTNYLQVAKRFVRNKRVQFKEASSYNLPFANNEFDYIICTEVLEHLEHDLAAIKELYRVLKPHGSVILSVPVLTYPFFWDPINYLLEHLMKVHIPSHIWWLAGIWADHVRLYKEQEIQQKAAEGGFTINQEYRSTSHCVPFAHLLLYGIGKNLVERGWAGDTWNRFTHDHKPSRLRAFVQWIFYVWDRYNSDTTKPGKPYLNYIAVLTKSGENHR